MQTTFVQMISSSDFIKTAKILGSYPGMEVVDGTSICHFIPVHSSIAARSP